VLAYRIPNLFRRLVGARLNDGVVHARVFTTWMRETAERKDVLGLCEPLFWTLALVAAVITGAGIVFSARAW